MWHAQAGKKGRGPCPTPPPDPHREEVMAWERESLDGEGLDDHFTLQSIAEIVTGRFRSQSAAYTNWSDGYSTVSSAWESKGPLYILLNPHVEVFMPMYASLPAIEDALKGRLGLPSWAQDSRAPKMDIDAMRALLLFTSLKR